MFKIATEQERELAAMESAVDGDCQDKQRTAFSLCKCDHFAHSAGWVAILVRKR